MSDSQNGVLLRGLDGINPLGFLAALGAFRLLSIENSNVKMNWQRCDGSWRPVLFGLNSSLNELGNELHRIISKLNNSAWSFDKKLPFEASRLKQHALEAVCAATVENRGLVDTVACLGVEFHEDDKKNFKDTSFRMVRSGDAAGQGLLAYGKRILDTTTPSEITEALTNVWVYRDKQCALRWDPTEDRGYALQWGNPSDDGALSVRGGNCLALLALVMFPTGPGKSQTLTTGFGLKEARQSSLTWPIWNPPIGIEVATTLIGISELQLAQPPRLELENRGIAAVYRCDRIMTSTYYANFTPARCVV